MLGVCVRRVLLGGGEGKSGSPMSFCKPSKAVAFTAWFRARVAKRKGS